MTDWDDDLKLYQAVIYACTLYLKKGKSCELACTKAATKYSVPVHRIRYYFNSVSINIFTGRIILQ